MKLGIMQPYFFPHLGYFDLINCTDRWVVFDTAQYTRKTWMNRNRVLHPNAGWSYITAPVKKHHRSDPIKDIEVADDSWRKRILGQVESYKKRGVYFKQVRDLVEDCLECKETKLSRLNAVLLDKVCQYLGIPFYYEYFSEMGLELGPVSRAGDWALRISEALGADEYINPPGGEALFAREEFEDAGIQLTIRDLPPMEYEPKGYEFIPRLSIIDVLMWNSPEQVGRCLNETI